MSYGRGRLDPHARLKGYCTGLMLPLAHKSADPMVARVDSMRASGRHRSLHHRAVKADWSGSEMFRWAYPRAPIGSTRLSVGLEALFTSASGLRPLWVVEDVKLDVANMRIDFEVSYSGALLSRPACGAASHPVGDRLSRLVAAPGLLPVRRLAARRSSSRGQRRLQFGTAPGYFAALVDIPMMSRFIVQLHHHLSQFNRSSL